FDAVNALRFVGRETYGKHWEACMEMCSAPGMVFEPTEVNLQSEAALAVAHALVRCGPSEDAKACFARRTSVLQQEQGRWHIVHEHFSFPFDMRTARVMFELQPDGTQTGTQAIPLGVSPLTPHLVCSQAGEAIEFYKKALAATEQSRLEMPSGGIAHACLYINGATVYL